MNLTREAKLTKRKQGYQDKQDYKDSPCPLQARRGGIGI